MGETRERKIQSQSAIFLGGLASSFNCSMPIYDGSLDHLSRTLHNKLLASVTIEFKIITTHNWIQNTKMQYKSQWKIKGLQTNVSNNKP